MITRRAFLERAAAAGALLTLPTLAACPPATSDDDLPADTDDGLPTYSWDGAPGPEGTFSHGVASGDPLADRVLLWTRVAPEDDEDVDVFVEVATDPDFAARVAAGWFTTSSARDGTLKIDVTDLAPGTTHYFRFRARGRTSPVGRTRTLPADDVERLRLGVCSCSNYAFGYFHAYRHMAARPDLDVVLHLGDYLYEYANEGFGRTYGTFRTLVPDHEILSLDDYRGRYANYRSDPDLAELHRQNAMIHVWDDHEFANDPFVGGADNHQPDTEGDWNVRVAAAIQAYDEWMPTRLGDRGRIFRTFRFGDLAHLVMLDRQRRFLFPDEADDHYLGKEQADWLDAELTEISTTWLVLGQGTRFAPRRVDGTGASWDATSRRRTLDAIAAADVDDLVVLTGDIHKFDALDVVHAPDTYDPEDGTGSEGVEIACGSVTSPGTNGSTTDVPFYLWSSGFQRGYVVLDLTPAAAQADAFGFPDLFKEIGPEEEEVLEVHLASFRAAVGTHHLVQVSDPAPTREDAPAPAPTGG